MSGYYTEDEARTKWCPFVRLRLFTTGGSQNRGHETDDKADCIGSACMAWRWATTITEVYPRAGIARANTKTEGYCGLAGQP